MKSEHNSMYDAELFYKLGADEFGMKKYILALLKRGPNRNRSEEESRALQAAHLRNIQRMSANGQLVLAGPFLDEGEIRGIYIFNVSTIEEARALTLSDPAIEAGSLVMELRPWYGSAALIGLSEMHKKINHKDIAEQFED